MTGSGIHIGQTDAGQTTNVVAITTRKPVPVIESTENPLLPPGNSPVSTDIRRLSQKNDPFGDLATRLTDVFSESRNNKAQEIKNACWSDLTEDKKPVFEPNFENLKTAQFSKSPEGLTITLSPDHVDQGYLQVLSDLTLVAEMIKRSINKNSENSIVGFTSDPIEKIKIISHPKRNTVITVQAMIKNNPYEIGPEFKFVNSRKDGIIPVANGMFNLDDVQADKLRTRSENNHQLEVLAFNRSENTLNNPLLHMFAMQKPILTAQNRIYLTPLANSDSYEHEAIMRAFKYEPHHQKLLEFLGQHNGGTVFHKTTHNPPTRESLETSHLDPSYTDAVREMSDYTRDQEKPEYYHHGTEEMLRHPDLGLLARMDGLTLLEQGTYPKDEGLLTTRYTKENVDRELLLNIHAKHVAKNKAN